MAHYLLEELSAKLRNDGDIWDFIRRSCLDGVWYWDLEKPENEWMSPEFWQLFGYDPKTKPQAPDAWFDIIHPDDKELAIENFNRHVADPAHPYDQIVRYRHAAGHTVWVRCRGLAIRDSEGRAIRMLGAHTDLTAFVNDTETREQTAARLAARLSAVFDAAQSGIIGLDRNRNVVTLNLPARHLLGGVVDEGVFPWPASIRFLDGTNLKPLDASNDPVSRALAGAHLTGEVHLLSRDGGEENARYVRISSARADAADTDVHSVIVLDDVTEQERNRQQIERQSRLDALGQLTGGIAHDFNNLLSTVLYAITLVQDDLQTERSQRVLRDTRRTVERGRDLTSRLLAFAKRKSDAPSHHAIERLFSDFQTLVDPTIEEKIKVTYEVETADLSVFCDQNMLENALLNLVLNSRDAILRAGRGDRIVLTASVPSADDLVAGNGAVERGAKANGFVRISVTDNGPGMDREVRRRATDPFFSTKGPSSGTGLGLSMVFGFARQAGGWMQLKSAPGEGTTVILVLPKGRLESVSDKADGVTSMPSGLGETVLLVEDETILLQMMTEQLEDLGYQVIPVETGAAAAELIEAGLDYDVLLTDVVMPGGVGGFELVRRARAARADIPSILLSGYTGYSEDDRDGIEAAILQKPCAPEELATTLRDVLELKTT